MTVLPLVPKTGNAFAPRVLARLFVPAQDDWAASYYEIERLYVRERRKLRYVMQHMTEQYGFKAT